MTTYRERQDAQMARYMAWVTEQGKDGRPPPELPIQLDTLMRPEQMARLDWLKANVQGTVLDVGCNFGFVTAYVGGHAGVDISEGSIHIAKLLAAHRDFRVADAKALPFEDDSFDTVLLCEVLEHLALPDEVLQALREAQRVARKHILITVPAYDSEESTNKKHRWRCDEAAIDVMASQYLAWGPGHIYRHPYGGAPGFVCINAGPRFERS